MGPVGLKHSIELVDSNKSKITQHLCLKVTKILIDFFIKLNKTPFQSQTHTGVN